MTLAGQAQSHDPPAALSSPSETPAPKPAQKNILILFPVSRLVPAVIEFDAAFRSTVEEQKSVPVNFFAEYVDQDMIGTDAAHRSLRDLLREKYRARKIDVVLTLQSQTLRFLMPIRRDVFPGARVVFFADREASADIALDSSTRGTWLEQGWAGTAGAALRLRPETRHIFVVGGTTNTDKIWLAAARRQLAALKDRVEINYVTGLPLNELVRIVSALPEHSVVLLGSFLGDSAGRTYTGTESVRRIAAAANAPTFILSEAQIGAGPVGGYVTNFAAHGRQAARLTLEAIGAPVLHNADTETKQYVFDGRQLARWNINESTLPPNSIVRNRPPNFWRSYGWYAAGGAAALFLQTALIIGLFINRARWQRAQQELSSRLRLEGLFADFSAAFATATSDDLDLKIDHALGRIADELDLDRAILTQFGDQAPALRVTHASIRSWAPSVPAVIQPELLPWFSRRLREGTVLAFDRLAELPAEAATDAKTIESLGTRSLAVTPLAVGGETLGALWFCAVRSERPWDPAVVQRMRLLGEIIAAALARRAAHQAARESEGRFRLLAETAPIIVWLAGVDGYPTYLNERWIEFAGRAGGVDPGRSWLDAIHPDDRAAVLALRREAMAADNAFTIEYRARDCDGEYRWLLDHGVPRRAAGGDVTGYIGCAIDVTEMKAGRKALDESNALRSAIFGSLYGQIAALDRNGVIIAVNEAWQRFGEDNGLSLERSGVGTSYLDVCRRAASAGNADAQRALDAINAVRDGKVERSIIEYSFPAPPGETWFALTVEPLRESEGGLLVAHVDITRRVHAEEVARREIQERAHIQRVTLLGEITASLAHEIAQPLAAIGANARAAHRMLEASRGRREDMRGALKDIGDDAKRASDIISRLRTLLRNDEVTRTPVDLRTVVSSAVRILHPEIFRRRITVREMADDVPAIEGDFVQLQQVMLNLLVNACDAIDAADNGPRDIVVSVRQSAPGSIGVSVRDTGIGVAEPDLSRIFDHFVSTKSRGLGMGLAISRSIVQSHGGRIWASRNSDRGLTLHIAFRNQEV